MFRTILGLYICPIRKEEKLFCLKYRVREIAPIFWQVNIIRIWRWIKFSKSVLFDLEYVLLQLSHWIFGFKPNRQLLTQVMCIDVRHPCIEHLNNFPTIFRSLAVSLLARFFCSSTLTESLAQASIRGMRQKWVWNSYNARKKNPPECTDIIKNPLIRSVP